MTSASVGHRPMVWPTLMKMAISMIGRSDEAEDEKSCQGLGFLLCAGATKRGLAPIVNWFWGEALPIYRSNRGAQRASPRHFLGALDGKVHCPMDEFFDLPTLIVIAVAIFVLFRLRSVLGTRTGNERPPVERRKPAEAAAGRGHRGAAAPARRRQSRSRRRSARPQARGRDRAVRQGQCRTGRRLQGRRRGRSDLYAQELPRWRQAGL